ncbi:hypothetical protein GCM10010435_57660 [Winogradskya consettensis]|uniref:Uncharacterized protein n=1 Tax=Winogradskya consettensis TaxID=113560 RepID=A0A919S982_9ACTN|nr:hypothetical protein Aco04nite_04660 [Actinoplanes consettensis]
MEWVALQDPGDEEPGTAGDPVGSLNHKSGPSEDPHSPYLYKYAVSAIDYQNCLARPLGSRRGEVDAQDANGLTGGGVT